MKRWCLILVFLILPPFSQAGEPVFSGPQPGEKLTPFKVLAVTGPQAGKEIETLSTVKGSPLMLVFVHDLTRPALQLMKPLDHYAGKWAKDGLATHFVWLSADKAKTEAYLQSTKTLNLKSAVSISLDGLEGPGNFGLNRKVALTILVAKDNKTLANFAIVQPNETDAPKVLAAVAKLVNKKPPTLEEIQTELGGKVKPPAGKFSPELQKLMRQMIQKTNDEVAVKKIAQDMVQWAGQDKGRRAELRDYCRLVVRLGYGTEAAQAALKRLAEKE